MQRGTLGFEVASDGRLVDCPTNVDALRRLWLDRTVLDGEDLGDGDPGDFDHGAWHIACHLVAAGGIMQASDGCLMWLEVSHAGEPDSYLPTITTSTGGFCSVPLISDEGQEILNGAEVIGFVEGNSLGRTSARGVEDSVAAFNSWRRQTFDQPIDSESDGGKVWEHWCTTRDIRASADIGCSVLAAYTSLVAALGDLYPALVARGRSDYAHPRQLAALVEAGFVGRDAALVDIAPRPLPTRAERQLLHAEPALALEAVSQLDWSDPPCYYMFQRRIDRWCSIDRICGELDRTTR